MHNRTGAALWFEVDVALCDDRIHEACLPFHNTRMPEGVQPGAFPLDLLQLLLEVASSGKFHSAGQVSSFIEYLTLYPTFTSRLQVAVFAFAEDMRTFEMNPAVAPSWFQSACYNPEAPSVVIGVEAEKPKQKHSYWPAVANFVNLFGNDYKQNDGALKEASSNWRKRRDERVEFWRQALDALWGAGGTG